MSLKRCCFALLYFVLISTVSVMTFINAGATVRIVPSDHCDGGDCCTDIECSCFDCCDNLSLTGFEGEVAVEDEFIPLFSSDIPNFFLFAPFGMPTWAIFNLLLTAAGVLFTVITVARTLYQKKSENDEIDEQTKQIMIKNSLDSEGLLDIIENDEIYCRRRRLIALTVMYVLSFAAVLLLLLTQNFKGIIAVFDIWSVIHAIMFAFILSSGRLVFKTHGKELSQTCIS